MTPRDGTQRLSFVPAAAADCECPPTVSIEQIYQQRSSYTLSEYDTEYALK